MRCESGSFLSRRFRGQSSVELLVSAAVIVPIVLLIPTLANLLMAQTETHKAARYVAWERVAYPDGQLKTIEQQADDVEKRFFRNSRSGFGDSVAATEETIWRDWGRPQPNPSSEEAGLIDYAASGGIAVNTVSSSATEGYTNTSAFLANRGGAANAIQLNTLQSGELSVGVRGDSSLLGSALSAPSIDPVTGEPRFHTRSSSALVVDSWMPQNDAAFSARVRDIGRGARNIGPAYSLTAGLLRNVFDEIDEHMYVNTPGTESPFDMVDPEQSMRLPPQLVQP